MTARALFLSLSLTGCSFFLGPESTLKSEWKDCSSSYEDWTEDLKDADEDQTTEILNDVLQFEASHQRTVVGAKYDLVSSLMKLDDRDREDRHEELIDELEDPWEDCQKAIEDFNEELADNEDACEAYFEWIEDWEDEWEGWNDETEDRDDDCDDKDHCFEPERVIDPFMDEDRFPYPTDKMDKDDCED